MQLEKHPFALNPDIIKKFTVAVKAPLPKHLLKHKERVKYLENGKTTKGTERKRNGYGRSVAKV